MFPNFRALVIHILIGISPFPKLAAHRGRRAGRSAARQRQNDRRPLSVGQPAAARRGRPTDVHPVAAEPDAGRRPERPAAGAAHRSDAAEPDVSVDIRAFSFSVNVYIGSEERGVSLET